MSRQEATAAAIGGIVVPSAFEDLLLASAEREQVDTAEHVEPYDLCRCERTLVCGACLKEPGDCDCSNVADDEAEAEAAALGEDVADLDPLTRTLMGLPSGIHCHVGGRCHSGHCNGGRA